MTRKILIAVWAVLALAAAGGVIWFYAAGNVGDPTEVTAPPITAATSTAPQAEPASTTTSEAAAVTPATEGPAPATTSISSVVEEEEEASGDDTDQISEPEPEPEPELEPEDGEETEEATIGDTVELQLLDGTEARFLIYEDLRGEPFTVVGVTTEVVGRINVDRADLAASQMGDILINARTFATDSGNRDRAIRGPILDAERFEFITFRPLGISGLWGPAEPGVEWSFTVEGELIVRDVTRAVTFEVTARLGDGDVLEGEASATVLRSDFDLSVPSVPFVANVADEIGLELDFIAGPVGLG